MEIDILKGIENLKKNVTHSVFKNVASLGHEQVVYCYDKPTGLKAIIAIHSTILGPALGGVRIWDYASEQESLTDVLRLSRGMTYKASINELGLGGGKAIIIGNPAKVKSEALMRRFGQFINSLGGKYITANDVNVDTSEIEWISMETKHVTGLPMQSGGSGSPAPATAYGTYLGMKAAAKKAYGNDSLEGKKIGVQGVGHVGAILIEYLVKEGAQITISDISDKKIKEVAKKFNAHVVGQDEIYNMDIDIYAPCAMGASLNDDTIPKLKCAIVAGSANNQLAEEKKHGEMLVERGIVYAPDFLINAGGLINVYNEYLGDYSKERAYMHIEKIYGACLNIFNYASRENTTVQEMAIQLSQKRIAEVSKIRIHG